MATSPTLRTTMRTVVPVVAVLALAACGGDDDSSDGDSDSVPTAVVGEAESGVPPTAPAVDDVAVATTLTPGGVELDEVPEEPGAGAGGEPSGTVSVGGETWELAGLARMLEDGEVVELGGDFLICEGDNPAFPGDANIIAVLDDNLQFSFLKNGDETTVEYGDLFGAEETTSVEFERDGSAISGSAELPESGSASFVLDCG